MESPALRMLELKQKGYCCAQILLLLALEAQGRTNADLVRASAGLCYGAGMSGELCGSFSGAACLISLYAAKGAEEEEPDKAYLIMQAELAEWFREEIGAVYGGIRCDDILERAPDKSACGPIVAATFSRVVEILNSHGYDLASGKGG